jgi:hypothetical protein
MLLGLALLSAGGLVLELSLVRVLSAFYAYTYVYVVLSLALLGVGLGAALAALRPRWRTSERLSLWAALAGLSALLLTAAAPWAAARGLPELTLLASSVPYLFVGLALATAFARHSQASPRLYWADLTGAALGTLSAIPILNAVGGFGGMLVGGTLLAGSSLAFGGMWAAGALTGLGFVLLSVQTSIGTLVDYPSAATSKPIRLQLDAGGEIVETRWNAFARTDLVYRPDHGSYYLYMDGGAGSLVPSAQHPERWRHDIGRFPFVADPPERVFVIGPGGGLDIALARATLEEAPDIVAVELNAASVALTRALADYASDLYGSGVTVKVDEGRSALRRDAGQYDLIFLSQVVAQAAEARGLALSENSVYTVEAFHDYLDHLAPGGQIALKLYDEPTLTRALFTVLQALLERGSSDAEAARHLLALLDTRASPPIPLLVVYDEPLTRSEAVRRARVAEGLGLALLYVPELLAHPPLDGLLGGEVGLEQLVADTGRIDLRPTRDDWPFFFQFERGVPQALRPLAFTLGTLLLGGLVALAGFGRQSSTPVRLIGTFALLGVGFMTVEIAALQRSQLFLGHPTVNLSVVLATLLLGGGLGSNLAGRVAFGGEARAVRFSALAVGLVFALWLAAWPHLSQTFLHASLPWRSLVVAASLSPLALALGMPFPLALRWAGRYREGAVALGWAVNGVTSVAAAVGATIFALMWGFGPVALLGLASYGLLWIVSRR